MTIYLGGCGIMSGYKEMKMVKYLNEKYPEDHFRYEETIGGTWLGGLLGTDQRKQILCSSENYPNQMVKVSCFWDEQEYHDNYLNIKFAKDMDEFAQDLIQEMFPEAKTEFLSFEETAQDSLCIALPANVSFDDYLKKCNEVLIFGVRCDNNQIDKKEIENIVEAAMENKEIGLFNMRIFFINAQGESPDFRNDSFNYLSVNFKEGRILNMEWEL